MWHDRRVRLLQHEVEISNFGELPHKVHLISRLLSHKVTYTILYIQYLYILEHEYKVYIKVYNSIYKYTMLYLTVRLSAEKDWHGLVWCERSLGAMFRRMRLESLTLKTRLSPRKEFLIDRL